MRIVVDTNIFVSAALKQGSLPYIAVYQASQGKQVFLRLYP
jgi:predicted nucleic acid-binding protein